MQENFMSGVFKIPVAEDFIYYYAQSSLVCYDGKLYSPEKFQFVDSTAFIREAMLAWYSENRNPQLKFSIYCGHEQCRNVHAIVIRRVNGEGRAVYNQNHLIDYHVIHPPNNPHIWARFLLNQDQITVRIIRIQQFVRSTLLRRKQRLHLLAVIAVNNKLNTDVISLIANML